jgi:hypothetical protein
MMPRLSTKIGIISFVLILIIALSTVLVNAQSPSDTTVPGQGTVTVTASPLSTNNPVMSSFTVDITQTDEPSTPPTQANVKLTVKLDNFDLSTASPTSTATDATPQGLMMYTFDPVMTSPGATASAMPPLGSTVPTATSDSMPAVAGVGVLSSKTSFTFNNVSIGLHTFSVELVTYDGQQMDPRPMATVQIYVMPPK